MLEIEEKYHKLQQILKKLDRVVVAYSGGVDSTFLVKTAVDTLGTENVLACIGVSTSMPNRQLKLALEFAKSIGSNIDLVWIVFSSCRLLEWLVWWQIQSCW